ncbi:uncharacterized protein METZ01_LOCUS56011, partial [marine metagenome]
MILLLMLPLQPILPIRYHFGKLDDGRKISFSNILILKGKMVG